MTECQCSGRTILRQILYSFKRLWKLLGCYLRVLLSLHNSHITHILCHSVCTVPYGIGVQDERLWGIRVVLSAIEYYTLTEYVSDVLKVVQR